MKTLFSILILFISYNTLHAQVTQEWVATYNGKSNSLAVDSSGNSYVTGSGNNGYVTIKYNSAGVQQWVANYAGSDIGSDKAYAIAVDGAGNVYVTGNANNIGSDDDYATIKYNSSGVQQWAAIYNGPPGTGEDIAQSIAIDGSGNVYVTGASPGNGTGYDYATIKYNSSGVRQWVSRYNGPANSTDLAFSIAVSGSGNVYVTGGITVAGTSADLATIKYNSAGVQQWVVRYSNGSASSVAVDGSENIYVTGGGSNDYATIKYNSAGVQQWVSSYNGPGNSSDYARSIALDISGNVYVTGGSRDSTFYFDYATIKYNSIGAQQWVSKYSGPGNNDDEGKSLAVDLSGNVYVTGYSYGIGTTADYATIKYNSTGAEQWVSRYNGSGNNRDEATSIALDGSGNVFVTGYITDNMSNYSYATIKYSQSTGIHQTSSTIPDQFRLYQNYPNPFNPGTVIRYQLTVSSFAVLKVYDILSNEVAILVNEKQSPGTYEVEFDGSGFTNGVYFYRLVVSLSNPIETGSFIDTKRMLLIK